MNLISTNQMSRFLFCLCLSVLKCEAFRLLNLRSAVMDLKASFRGVQPFESVATLLFSAQKSSTSLYMTSSDNENEKVRSALLRHRKSDEVPKNNSSSREVKLSRDEIVIS